MGTTEEPLVDRKNLGTLEEPTYDPLSRMSLLVNPERSDKATSELFRRNGPSSDELNNLFHRNHEVGEDRDRKGDPNPPKVDLELPRKITIQSQGCHEIKLGVVKREFGGGVQPFSDDADAERLTDRKGKKEGRQPPLNTPLRSFKTGPPRTRKLGRVRTFDDLATIESRARAKEATRGRSEIRITYEETQRSPDSKFWDGPPGLSTPSLRSSGISSSSPSRAASVERSTETTATTIRSVDKVLPEVIKILRQLKNELSMALDVETRLMIHEVQIDAQEMMVLRGSRKGEKDDDGDVTMGKEETHPRDPVPTYFQPSSPEPDQSNEPVYVPRSPVQEDGIPQEMSMVKGAIETLQWKVVNLEDHNERIVALEARMKVAEDKKAEEGWKLVRGPSRREVERPRTRSQTQRAELAIGQDIVVLQTRMTALEKVMQKNTKGGDNNRRRVNGLDMRVGGAEGEVMASRKKVAELEKKEEESRLRQVLALRELTQTRNFITESVNGRMARVEARLLELEYRSATSADQIQWNDQKIRGIWNAFNSANPEEACAHTAALRQIWINANGAFTRRQNNIPYASVTSRFIESAPNQPTASGTSPTKGGEKPPSF